MSNKEKNGIIGRDFTREGVCIAGDHRPENPKLDPERYAITKVLKKSQILSLFI